jgi:catechol 2,3-dioxygenase-like lactoylglutathione lyase family enzyme
VALQHISVVSVYVSDQDKAIDFFVNKLGFELVSDEQFGEGQRWVQVKTPEGETSITISKASEFGMTPGNFAGLVFYSDDVKGTVADFKSKGIEITEEANEQMWGVQAQFKDPDGNTYVIVGK